MIKFKTEVIKINSWIIIKIPKSVSMKLPSRALTMVDGKINGKYFKAVLEPDGRGSHWFQIS